MLRIRSFVALLIKKLKIQKKYSGFKKFKLRMLCCTILLQKLSKFKRQKMITKFVDMP